MKITKTVSKPMNMLVISWAQYIGVPSLRKPLALVVGSFMRSLDILKSVTYRESLETRIFAGLGSLCRIRFL